MTYPRAEIITASFGNKLPDMFEEIENKEFNPIINITPINPTMIEKNFLKLNLSSFVKKWENANAKIGAIESKRPAVFDWINCSDQLINKNGIKFPI